MTNPTGPLTERPPAHALAPEDSTPDPTAPDPTAQLLATLRAALWPILAATLLAGAGAYLLASLRPRVYEASSALVTSGSAGGNLGAGPLVSARALPTGALNQALRSPAVVAQIIAEVSGPDLPEPERRAVLAQLERQMVDGNNRAVSLSAVGEGPEEAGVLLLRARANSPQVASRLANAGARALLNWDTQRVRKQLERARLSYLSQLKALEKDTPDTDLYDTAHHQARAALLQSLALTGAMQESATATLEVLTEATPPQQPVAPTPLRSAVISALLALLASGGVAALLGRGPRRRAATAPGVEPTAPG